ncbi:hypothetical protein BpHYR1_042739 [Brachionus plicatilis]|uniref:Uncharacterized protein n=1 Tax=Brachionus plicatilis TaxID=10195 RepID=A0A3M7SAJ9_BRAPC|nr:hypothetical protein BpHYR1_042739 [Brachionus plicatilis]
MRIIFFVIKKGFSVKKVSLGQSSIELLINFLRILSMIKKKINFYQHLSKIRLTFDSRELSIIRAPFVNLIEILHIYIFLHLQIEHCILVFNLEIIGKMNISLLVILMNLIASATMEQADDPMLSNSGEFLAKNSTLLANLIRTNIKNELRKLKSSVTDSIMEEFLNYYSKKLETVDTLNTNFDLLSKKVALMAKNLNILAQNYRVISKNHRNLVNIVRNNMIANKELNQKSIDASKHNREKLKSDFIDDLENKYSVLFDGGILEVLKSIQDSPKTASHSPLVQTTPFAASSRQLVIENIPTVRYLKFK